VKNIRDTHPESVVIYLLEGIDDYLKQQKLELDRIHRKTENAATTTIFRVNLCKQDVEQILVWLQVEAKAHVWETRSAQESADYIFRLSVTLATAPFRQENAFSGFCAESITRTSHFADTWLNQLMQITGVSFQIAKTVCTQYPSFQSLMKMYECEGMTQKTKENLLADLERVDATSARKLGPAISRKIYSIFNEVDGTKLVHDL